MATRLFWNFMGISGTEIQNVIQQTRIILSVVSQKGELYQEIMDKQRYLQSHGYTYICEWGKNDSKVITEFLIKIAVQT